jgi:hypothetical protein
MKRYLTIPLLAAALCLTACNLFPTLDPEPIVDPTEPMTVEAAYEKVQAKLAPFSRRGISRCKELIPAQTMLYYMLPGSSQVESTVLVKSPTWVFFVGPDANANGVDEWLYVYVNALNGEWGGEILKGELVGLTWETIQERTALPDNFTLFRAETLIDPTYSRWIEIAEGSGEIQKEGQHVWLRRFDSEAELRKAYSMAVPAFEEYQSLDWDTKTLLLVAGYETFQNQPYDLTFDKQEDGSYQVKVYRTESIATSALWWTRAIIVDKLAADAVVSVKPLYLGQ